MQKYIDICNKTADKNAQGLRDLANLIGREASHVTDGGTEVVLRLSKDAIKRKATDMQNLVRTMAEQLAIERAECERMKRMYAAARKEASHLEDMVERAKAQ